MDINVDEYIGTVEREVVSGNRDGQETRIVTARRVYQTSQADLWDALTNPERIPRWFLPVEGELHAGGHFQFQGNAGGDILTCDKPEHIAVTWGMGGNTSWVDVTLSAEDEQRTLLTLRHEAPLDKQFWDQYGPGAVGVGWELGLMGLGVHLNTGEALDPEEGQKLHLTDHGRAFIKSSSENWMVAAIAAGFDSEDARAAGARTTAFYLGESESGN